MNKKNKAIIVLLVIGALAFCTIRFIIIPHNNAKQEQYNANQNDSLTHDIANVLRYKSAYVGDSSNDANLFYHLPLSSVSMKFQINPDDCSLTVNYLDTVWNIGEGKVHRDLVYNSAAAMALIDNLKQITYEFSGATFVFTREKIENSFGSDLSSFLDKETWNKKIQSRLNDSDFVSSFYKQ
ncbi:MAG: DUF4825 domain-containing protein [Bacillota bacterium]|nr:DUF4825 domain-containing protein [Bacillota bacterium]